MQPGGRANVHLAALDVVDLAITTERREAVAPRAVIKHLLRVTHVLGATLPDRERGVLERSTIGKREGPRLRTFGAIDGVEVPRGVHVALPTRQEDDTGYRGRHEPSQT